MSSLAIWIKYSLPNERASLAKSTAAKKSAPANPFHRADRAAQHELANPEDSDELTLLNKVPPSEPSPAKFGVEHKACRDGIETVVEHAWIEHLDFPFSGNLGMFGQQTLAQINLDSCLLQMQRYCLPDGLSWN